MPLDSLMFVSFSPESISASECLQYFSRTPARRVPRPLPISEARTRPTLSRQCGPHSQPHSAHFPQTGPFVNLQFALRRWVFRLAVVSEVLVDIIVIVECCSHQNWVVVVVSQWGLGQKRQLVQCSVDRVFASDMCAKCETVTADVWGRSPRWPFLNCR